MNYGKIGKMKYIEEITNGECFVFNNHYYLLTSDFKSNGQRLAYSLYNGSSKWFDSNTIINTEPVYILDKENNVVAIRPTKKDDLQT